MEQDPIPGWDEMAKIPKEREDEHITNYLIQQAGMVDPDPSQRRTPTKNLSVEARRGRTQGRRRVSAPKGHLLQSEEKTEWDKTHTSSKRPKKIKLEK